MADSSEKDEVTQVTEEVEEVTEEEMVTEGPEKNVVTSSVQSTGTEMENAKQASKLKKARTAKLSQLTKRKNVMIQLMEDVSGFHEVRDNLHTYKDLLERFKDIHRNYQELLTEEERKQDDSEWFEPKINEINTFLSSVSTWISGASRAGKPQEEEEISPKDSASQADPLTEFPRTGASAGGATFLCAARLNRAPSASPVLFFLSFFWYFVVVACRSVNMRGRAAGVGQ
ncbi:hypothetical protein N1851_020399 [Merluccius polli]|uniref:Uncharacterized protein n=1 Tax=Merluccius polli TaxID=89951 RepID=A0AA47MKC4_MERPO|nr:hypothetical protein N1851_020399 [Merluccius polli]